MTLEVAFLRWMADDRPISTALEPAMANDFLFRATNRHVESCGKAPCSDEPPANSNVFRSYFENAFGEQWIFHHDGQSDRITIRGGDCGWQNEMTVTSFTEALKSVKSEISDGVLERANSLGMTSSPVVCGDKGPVMLGKAEQMWVATCMEVVHERRRLKPS